MTQEKEVAATAAAQEHGIEQIMDAEQPMRASQGQPDPAVAPDTG